MEAAIRRAVPADADGIGAVSVRAWQAAYRGIMPDDFLDALDPNERAGTWWDALAGSGPDRRVVVAVDGDRVVGFAAFGPARSDATTGELYALNVDPQTWGAGVGRRLLRTATTWLGDAGYAEAELFVAIGNERARRFYEAEHWTDDGTEVTEDALGAVVREARYRRRLRP